MSESDPQALGQHNKEDVWAIYAGAKCRIAALEQQLEDIQNAGTKHKSDLASNITQGCIIPRLVSLFQSVDELVDKNDRRSALEIDNANSSETNVDEQRTFRRYQLLVKHIPPLEEKLTALELRKGASGARGDDAANLKPAVVGWLAELLKNPEVPLSLTNKCEHGFEHALTGQLLCPIEFDWEDENIQQNIRDGHPDFNVTVDSWPAFLYPHAKARGNEVSDGLFRSAILVKAFKFLFTSPTSAEEIQSENDVEVQARIKRSKNRKAPTRGNVANILSLRSATPRAIAYVAVQLRFALSNATSWNENDGCFSYPTFYNNIIDFFEDTPGPAA